MRPKSTIEEVIEKLSDAQIERLIEQFEQFERDGVIGECELRDVASEVHRNISGCGITIWMNLIASECYRHFANKCLGRKTIR